MNRIRRAIIKALAMAPAGSAVGALLARERPGLVLTSDDPIPATNERIDILPPACDIPGKQQFILPPACEMVEGKGIRFLCTGTPMEVLLNRCDFPGWLDKPPPESVRRIYEAIEAGDFISLKIVAGEWRVTEEILTIKAPINISEPATSGRYHFKNLHSAVPSFVELAGPPPWDTEDNEPEQEALPWTPEASE